MASTQQEMHIYICYNDEDSAFLGRLQECLDPKVRRKQLTYWSRNNLGPGDVTRDRMAAELGRADVVIMLISAPFLAFREQRLLEEYEAAGRRGSAGEALIVPVVVRSTHDWQDEPLIGIYPAALEGKPIDLQPNEAAAWVGVMEWIGKILATKADLLRGGRNSGGEQEGMRDMLIKIARDMDRVLEGQADMKDALGQLLELSGRHLEELASVRRFADEGRFTEAQMVEVLGVMDELLAVHAKDLSEAVRAQVAGLKAAEDVKQRFKLTLPVIPYLLRYELEAPVKPSAGARGLWGRLLGGRVF